MRKIHSFLIIGLAILILIFAPFIGIDGIVDNEFIFWQLRLPRVLNGLLVGATLSLSGAAFQSLFGNPLATPSTTGTTAGASLGALIAIVLLPAELSWNGMWVTTFAFVGALLISIPLSILATHSNVRMEDVLLAGIGCTLAAGAISTGLQFQADMTATYRAVQWSLGSLTYVGYKATFGILPWATISIIGLLSQYHGLEMLISGEQRAWSQGVNIIKVRTLTLLFASLGVAACVAWCGPIAFVGLLVPHLIRLGISTSRKWIMIWSILIGPAFLILCDMLARLCNDVPVGVITSALGAPMLLALILWKRKH